MLSCFFEYLTGVAATASLQGTFGERHAELAVAGLHHGDASADGLGGDHLGVSLADRFPKVGVEIEHRLLGGCGAGTGVGLCGGGPAVFAPGELLGVVAAVRGGAVVRRAGG